MLGLSDCYNRLRELLDALLNAAPPGEDAASMPGAKGKEWVPPDEFCRSVIAAAGLWLALRLAASCWDWQDVALS
jgi:hypothetical protein